jgi:hypothetical protein
MGSQIDQALVVRGVVILLGSILGVLVAPQIAVFWAVVGAVGATIALGGTNGPGSGS